MGGVVNCLGMFLRSVIVDGGSGQGGSRCNWGW